LDPQKIALLSSLVVFILFATGFIYKGHHLFDTFRIPVRAMAFVALVMVLYLLIDFSSQSSKNPDSKFGQVFNLFLIASVIQIGILSFVHLRPPGSVHSPYDSDVQKIADILKLDNAKSVWVTNLFIGEEAHEPRSFQESTLEYPETYIDVVLTNNGLALLNVYYGDMGQAIPIEGPYCGYSFDHVIATVHDTDVELVNKLTGQSMEIIPIDGLELLDNPFINGENLYVYRIICKQ
jgi:hypothetical protein